MHMYILERAVMKSCSLYVNVWFICTIEVWFWSKSSLFYFTFEGISKQCSLAECSSQYHTVLPEVMPLWWMVRGKESWRCDVLMHPEIISTIFMYMSQGVINILTLLCHVMHVSVLIIAMALKQFLCHLA